MRLLVFLLCLLYGYRSFGQNIVDSKFGEGITVTAKDSSFQMNFSARIQSLYEGEFDTDSDDYTDGFQIRRARLKFGGFAYHPSFRYKIELAVANADMMSGAIPESGNTGNVVLDAHVMWNFYKRWTLLFGQSKLPGNRERVISSQDLQFVDRSLVNAHFNLDRDGGVQLIYNAAKVNLIAAISMGEGRNIIGHNKGGYGYTVRGEYLPFGQFQNEGDYFGSDLEREDTPKLSLGVSYDFNDDASREGGQLGEFFDIQRDLSTLFVDMHFKYKGFSSLIEYANRKSPDGPLIVDEDGNVENAFYTGKGITIQSGYFFMENIEIAGRYTAINPENITGRNDHEQYTIGLSKYFMKHNLKIQTDISLNREQEVDDTFTYRLQLEVAL